MPEMKRRGRPGKQSGGVDRPAIISCAQSMIRTKGLEKLTFRALAGELGVTAMAIKYHVGSRDQLLTDLAADAFEGVDASITGDTPCAELRHYLARYCTLALQNVGLVRFMLSDPTFMPQVLRDYTSQVRLRTQAINQGDPGDIMLNLLIDYVHGFVFAAEAAPAGTSLTLEDGMKSIDWLIDMVQSSR